MATVNEIVRCTLHYSAPGAGDMQNVFTWKIDQASPADSVVLDTLETWVNDVWAPAWRELAATAVVLESFEADILRTDGTVARNLGGLLVDIAGVVGGDVVAAGVAAYILGYTANPKARGSKYLPGLGEPIVEGGILSVNGLADLAVCLAVYLSNITVTGGGRLQPGVLSKTLATFIAFINAGALESVPAYQRRRKVGVGI